MIRVQIKQPDGNVINKDISELSELDKHIVYEDGHVSIMTADGILYITSWQNVLIIGDSHETK